jgi:hypothetical protein
MTRGRDDREGEGLWVLVGALVLGEGSGVVFAETWRTEDGRRRPGRWRGDDGKATTEGRADGGIKFPQNERE